jgi:Protein of unknown function (DUF3102)
MPFIMNKKQSIKARSLCGRLRGVARVAADRAVQEGKDPALAKHAAVIRDLSKRVMKDIIEIGRRLTEAKKLVGHGNKRPSMDQPTPGWAAWLKTEFDWSEGTALNFMHVFEFAEDLKNKKFMDLTVESLEIAPSAMYKLAQPSTPDAVRDEMMGRAGAGEAITNSAVQEALTTHAAADEAISTDETPPPPAADDEQQAAAEPRPAGAGNGQFVEDEDAWVRGLYYRAHKAIGDALRHKDWSKYIIDRGVIEMVKQCAEAWRELADYLEQRDGQIGH